MPVNTNKALGERIDRLEAGLDEVRSGYITLAADIRTAIGPYLPPDPGPSRPALKVIQGGAR